MEKVLCSQCGKEINGDFWVMGGFNFCDTDCSDKWHKDKQKLGDEE